MVNTNDIINKETGSDWASPIENGERIFNIVCRGSWLSLAQAEIFKTKIADKLPSCRINVIIRSTSGDNDQSTPLHLIEGKDFFTKEIQQALQKGEADFAIHSMKDVSGEDFFNESHYAIIDREDIRDVALFKPDVVDKLKNGEPIRIGTSSPRRSNMATAFLEKALPQFEGVKVDIQAIPIRGNVDTRLQKLEDGLYDGIILAAAGLNRLLQYAPAIKKVKQLLEGKKQMVLPLFECPPAAGQAAIVVETSSNNDAAKAILDLVKNEQLTSAIKRERKAAYKYGYGCSQQFGTFHLDIPGFSFTYSSGTDQKNQQFTEWDFETIANKKEAIVFASSDYMKNFFRYNYYTSQNFEPSTEAVFIASHKAVHNENILNGIISKRVWAAGTKTWLQLATKGVWVEGSADGLGLEFLQSTLDSSLIRLTKDQFTIVTNKKSCEHWIEDGWNTLATYELIPENNPEVEDLITKADLLFWTSFQQYQMYSHLIKATAQHASLPGKTAKLLIQIGIKPFLFPGIKSFNEWRKHTTI